MKPCISKLSLVVLVSTLTVLQTACGESPEVLLTSARTYMDKHDNPAAIIQIKNALQSTPDSPEARYLLGVALLDQGDAVGAETELRKAMALGHAPALVVPPLAKAMMLQGYATRLIDEFSQTTLSEPGAQASLQVALSSAYAFQQKKELSNQSLQAALKSQPGNAEALLAQARQQAATGDVAGALAGVDALLAQAPNDAKAWKLRGDIHYFAKLMPQQAVKDYQKAVELSPNDVASHAALITVLLKQGELKDAQATLAKLQKFANATPQAQYLKAQLAYQKKEFKQASELIQQVLKGLPNNALALQLAGAIELELGSVQKAQAYLSKALKLVPELVISRRLLVMSLLKTGQTASALEALNYGLSKAPMAPELLQIAGETYLQNGDLEKAQFYFSQAKRIYPEDTKSRTSLALMHLKAGQTDLAFGELQSIAAADKGISANLALISAYMGRKDYAQALRAIDELQTKQPGQALPFYLRGRVMLATQSVEQARKNFEQAVQLQPVHMPAVAILARLDLADKKPAEAKKRFEAVLQKDPKNSQAWLALAELSVLSGALPAEVQALLVKAVEAAPASEIPRLMLVEFHLNQRDWKQASAVAQVAVADLPDRVALLEALARTQVASGDLNQAIVSYKRVTDAAPLSAPAHLRLAQVQLLAKNPDAAGLSLRKALELKPDLPEAQSTLVALALESATVDKALAMARTVQSQRPQEAAGYALEGDILAGKKRWSEAEIPYRKALKFNKSSELAAKVHGVLSAGGKRSEADNFSNSWIKSNPKDGVFMAYLGDVGLARQDWASAEQWYQQILKLQPNNALIYNNLAWVSGRLKRDRAMVYAQKANELAPDQPAFQDTLAMLLSEKGEHAKALELQKKVVTAQPRNALFRLNLVRIHMNAGHKDLAKIELDELNNLGEKFAGHQEVKRLLKLL